VLDGITDAPVVVIGPVLWLLDQNGNRVWYFIAGSGGSEGFEPISWRPKTRRSPTKSTSTASGYGR
jgi:hypothetical protein